jgi:DNA replication protein DnaC
MARSRLSSSWAWTASSPTIRTSASSRETLSWRLDRTRTTLQHLQRRPGQEASSPFGPPGKSHVACGIGHALIDAGYRVLYRRTSELVQRLQAARQGLQLPQALAKLDRYDLLILDDISCVRKDQAETSVLFELIAERYSSDNGKHPKEPTPMTA